MVNTALFVKFHDVTDHSAWASWIFRSRAAKNFTALGHRNFFLRSPWAVNFLASLDRKIHDALAEWSVITHYKQCNCKKVT